MEAMRPDIRYNNTVTLLVIAGGSSRRMGADKLLLPVPPLGIPLVRHATERLMALAARTIVVANSVKVCEALRYSSQNGRQWGEDPAGFNTELLCLPDDSPGDGPLGGLATGLRRTEGWGLTVAGDMPFLSAAACQYLIDMSDSGCDAIVPILNGQAQPLHALYSSRCLPAVENSLACGLAPHGQLLALCARSLDCGRRIARLRLGTSYIYQRQYTGRVEKGLDLAFARLTTKC